MQFRHSSAHGRTLSRVWTRAALTVGLLVAPAAVRAGVAVTGTFTFSGTTGHVSSFAYNGGPIANLTVGSLDKAGVSSSSNSGNFRASNWPVDPGLSGSADTGKYFGFTLTAASGYTFDIASLDFGFGRSATGPRTSEWRSSVDNYASAIGSYSSLGGSGLLGVSNSALTISDTTTGATGVVLALSGSSATYAGLSTIGLRWYASNAEGSAGTGGFQGPLSFTLTLNSTGSGSPTPGNDFDAYRPPAGYYASATGTGSTLKAQLNAIIDDQTVISYDGLRTALQVTDADPANPGHMLLAYNRTSLDVAAINPGGPIPGWDGGASWNREHTWADSRGLGGTGPDYSDLHHLRACDDVVNSTRGNLNFGGAYGAQAFGIVTDGSASVWYPGDADAGMVARHEFYMATRYDGADANTVDLELLPGNPSDAQGLGSLTRMIEWHYQAAPDEFELKRNQTIYDSYQGNRNPYIDNPEYVWSVFVDQANDSQLSVGNSPALSGSSSLAVDLGRVITSATVPAAQSVTLRRSGNDGTYFRVTTSGSATSSLSDKFNAFPINTTGSDTRAIAVGLDTATATAGLKSGTVTIDNLDITSGGGTGRGAGDADDLITVSLSVLDHATPSFVSGSTSTSLMLNFGTLTQGVSDSILSLDLFNRAGSLGGLWTAGLDLDAIVETDPRGVFTTTLSQFLNLAAGSSRSAIMSMSTAVVGDFTGSYLLNFSDEDLPGATTRSMTVSLAGSVVAVPEPATMGLTGIAISCGLMRLRHRRRARGS